MLGAGRPALSGTQQNGNLMVIPSFKKSHAKLPILLFVPVGRVQRHQGIPHQKSKIWFVGLIQWKPK